MSAQLIFQKPHSLQLQQYNRDRKQHLESVEHTTQKQFVTELDASYFVCF